MRGEAATGGEEGAFLRAQIDAVFALNLPMIVMDALGCVLIAQFYWTPKTATVLGGWLAVNALALAIRIGVVIAYRRAKPDIVDVRPWADSLVAGAGFAGLMWGAAIVWMLATGTDNQVMFVMCVALSGLTFSIANVAYWPVYAVFAAPVTLASALGFAISDRPGGIVLSFGAATMTIALMLTSRQLSRQVLRAHRLAATNQTLVESLGERGRELEEACRVLEQMSRTDPLTGLANRRSRDDRLAVEWRRAMRYETALGVIAIDVDHFKRYNDTHGHAEGDRALHAVARILESTIRGPIDLAARHGGEEFMLILPAIDAEALAAIAERARARVAHQTAQRDLGLPERVTISLGAALALPGALGSVHDLVAAADAALYRAKLGGRDRVELAGIPSSAVSAAA